MVDKEHYDFGKHKATSAFSELTEFWKALQSQYYTYFSKTDMGLPSFLKDLIS